MGLANRRLIIFTLAALVLFAFVAISITVFDTGMASAQKSVHSGYADPHSKSVQPGDQPNPKHKT